MHQKSLFWRPKIEKKFLGRGTCTNPRPNPSGEEDTPFPHHTLSAPAAPRLGSCLRHSASPKPSHFPPNIAVSRIDAVYCAYLTTE